jgi:mono/diheme cytochrome c family protein
MDISIGPTGEELPDGHGDAKEGALVFQQKGCVGCHGKAGMGGMASALQSSRAGGSSPFFDGRHTAIDLAVRNDGVGFHPSWHASRERRNTHAR